MRTTTFTAAGLLLAASSLIAGSSGAALAADRVELKSGAIVEGTIEVVTDTKVVLRVGTETRELPRTLVARVVRDTASPAAETRAPEKSAGANAADAPATEKQTETAPAEPKPSAPNATTPATKSPAAPVAPAAEDEPPVVDTSIAKALGSGDPAQAAQAAESVITGWPGTLPSLKVAFASPSADCRREAILVVHQGQLAGVESLILKAARDADPSVRLLAIRVMRSETYKDQEGLLISIFSTDAELGVRHECLRTLEVVGTVKCLTPVLESFAKTEAPDTRRRHLRVLKTITGKDAKEDVEAWREIIRSATLESHLKK